MTLMPPPAPEPPRTLPPFRTPVPRKPIVTGPLLLGGTVGMLFFGVLGGWAALAPLASAAVATGEVVVESNRKTVQHLEGGIIRDILVRDGDRVSAGQVLYRLDATQAESSLHLHSGQLDALRALESRLTAERDGMTAITFPNDLSLRAASDPVVGKILDGQRKIFAARAVTLAGQRDIFTQRIEQLRTKIEGARAQLAAVTRQRDLIGSELADARFLMERGLMQRSRLMMLEREAAALDGRMGEITSDIAGTEQAIGETRLAIADLDDTRSDEVARELRDAQTRIAEVEQQVRSAADILSRQDIPAPVSGRVVDMKMFTPGGVITPGAELLSIVPEQDQLWVTARVSPTDIDVVHPGQKAQVTLAAYSQRKVPPLPGVLATISADRLVDQITGQAYFTARIHLDQEAMRHLEGVHLSPGMPAQAMIVTGEHTIFEYLTAPLAASLTRALREG